jgi:ferrochelatase
MIKKKCVGVFLLQMGGPLSLKQVGSYVERLFSDPYLVQLPPVVSWFRQSIARRVARRRTPVLLKQYEQIGGCSPNNAMTVRQAEALELALNNESNDTYRCYAAMTYTAPHIDTAVAEAVQSGCTSFIALSLFPQYCGATTGSSFAELKLACDAAGIAPESVQWINRWGENSRFIEAASDDLQRACEEAVEHHSDQPHVLFSAHGIPKSYVRQGDPYVNETRATVKCLATGLMPGVKHTLSFQSRATPVRWVTPSTIDAVKQLGADGVKSLIVHPVSFVNDHIETLFEIDIQLAAIAREAGIERFARVPTFNDDPRFIDTLMRLVQKEASA